MIGGIVMTHGDDKGLVFPPKLAPYQVVIVLKLLLEVVTVRSLDDSPAQALTTNLAPASDRLATAPERIDTLFAADSTTSTPTASTLTPDADELASPLTAAALTAPTAGVGHD